MKINHLLGSNANQTEEVTEKGDKLGIEDNEN